MIRLTRLSGSEFVLNSDLIERVDSTPDTVITLVDGTKYIVSESLSTIIELVIEFRGDVVSVGARLPEAVATRSHLAAVRAQSTPGPRRS